MIHVCINGVTHWLLSVLHSHCIFGISTTCLRQSICCYFWYAWTSAVLKETGLPIDACTNQPKHFNIYTQPAKCFWNWLNPGLFVHNLTVQFNQTSRKLVEGKENNAGNHLFLIPLSFMPFYVLLFHFHTPPILLSFPHVSPFATVTDFSTSPQANTPLFLPSHFFLYIIVMGGVRVTFIRGGFLYDASLANNDNHRNGNAHY